MTAIIHFVRFVLENSFSLLTLKSYSGVLIWLDSAFHKNVGLETIYTLWRHSGNNQIQKYSLSENALFHVWSVKTGPAVFARPIHEIQVQKILAGIYQPSAGQAPH